MKQKNMEAASIEIGELSFRYPGASDFALDGVSFSLAPGERLGLLGPNGAGKSTLMRVICGYLFPQFSPRSKARVAGYELEKHSMRIRERVGYLPEQVPLYTELRVREHLAFRASIKRVPRKKRMSEVGRVGELTGLSDMLEVPIHRLSRGYRQRVGIADALLGSPPLVVLDEPTVGLDPNQVQAIRNLLKNLGGLQTLIFSSHILAEVEALCDRIVILSRGKVVADERVRSAMSTGRIHVEWLLESGDRRAIEACAKKAWGELGGDREKHVPTWTWQEDNPEGIGAGSVDTQDVESSTFMRRLGQEFANEQIAVVRFEPGMRRLEQHFARVTGFDVDENNKELGG